MMSNWAINYDDEFLYEHLGIIINEYEEQLLKNSSRTALLASGVGPLAALKHITASAAAAIVSDVPPELDLSPNRDPGQPGVSDANREESARWGDGIDLPSPSFNIDLDADLRDLFGEDDGSAAAEYLTRCFGCSTRVRFRWQLQPRNLLEPVAQLLNDVQAAIESFSSQMDPWGTISGICDVLNGIDFLCIPDLISVLLAIKLQLRKYLTSALELRLDWTVLVGPFLKLIVDGFAGLITAIGDVVAAPVECAIASIQTANSISLALRNTISTTAAVGERIEDRAKQVADTITSLSDGIPGVRYDPVAGETVNAQVNFRDVGVDSKNFRIETTDREITDEQRTGTRTFPASLVFDQQVDPPPIGSPDFLKLSSLEKLVEVMRDSARFLREFEAKIISSFSSVKTLVGGGLTVQLGNLGIILLLKDMVGLVLNAIRLIRENRNVTDWCSFLGENPDALRPLVSGATSRSTTLQVERNQIAVYTGAERVAEFRTCLNANNNVIGSQMLRQWINELNRGN